MLFCCYSMKLNDRILCRYTKLCILILPFNCLLNVLNYWFQWATWKLGNIAMLLVLFLVKVLFAFKFWWASSLFTVMSVFWYVSEKLFSWKFDILTLFLVFTRFNMLFYYFLNFQNWLFVFLNYFKVWNLLNAS